MKRGKDEEKIMGPMFPRLHVNDTEKGGPRAPPRNKMALYEQLSIPSQRYNNGVSHKPNNTSNLVPPPTSSQGSGNDRSVFSLHHVPQTAEKPQSRFCDTMSLNTSLSKIEQRKKVVAEEDDLTVPVFVHPGATQPHNENRSLPGSTYSGQTSKLHSERDKDPKQSRNEQSTNTYPNQECRVFDGPLDKFLESREVENGSEDEGCEVVQNGNVDDVSETTSVVVSEASVVDSISARDISPDDVVGVLGQKHFWKARKEIAYQQRMFSVQVFELHRLIKVQRSIAGSPQYLLEGNAFIEKSLVKIPLPLQKKPDPPQPISREREDSQKPNTHMEFPANYEPNPKTPQPKMSPWYFPQPNGHQWLVPIMSPSEGLIYKPYPASGFPQDPTHMMGNFLNHYQRLGVVPPSTPLMGHNYFAPYGMQAMAPRVPRAGPDRVGHDQANRTVGSDVQISVASCPSERPEEGSDALPLFPTTLVGPVLDDGDGGPGTPRDTVELPPRVIKVVPHNARTATASAARIFKSIQDERKQH